MAEETMVKENLSEAVIEAGAKIVELLDKAKFSLSAAFWFYIPESNQWRLVFASPEVRIYGPKKSYRKVQSTLKKIDSSLIALENIAVIDNIEPIIALLKVAIKTGPGISGIRFSRNTINGTFIEDAYIYRMT